MPRSAKDIQLIELKDTVSQLNKLISTQVNTMESLNRTIEELRQELRNQKAENDYLRSKLFGSSSEKTPLWHNYGTNRQRGCTYGVKILSCKTGTNRLRCQYLCLSRMQGFFGTYFC